MRASERERTEIQHLSLSWDLALAGGQNRFTENGGMIN